jgi:hypothetical protein
MSRILLNNPAEQLLAVGKENTELHAELARVYPEIDRYRRALTALSEYPDGRVQDIARRALAG